MEKVYIGTYTKTGSKGIYEMDFEEQTGELHNLAEVLCLPNPTYLQREDYLYAISETDEKGGLVAVIDPITKEKIASAAAGGTGFCHLCLDQSKRFIVASGYHGGYFAVFARESDNALRHIKDYQHHGEKPSHCHYAAFSKDNRHLLVADLGLDTLFCYRFHHDTGEAVLEEGMCYKGVAGSGPRHFVLHPTCDFIFLVNELNSTVDVLRFNGTEMKCVFSISTLPQDEAVESYCAAIRLSLDGKYLYASNRGHDSIAVFAVCEDGTLLPKAYTKTNGQHPRDFAIHPSGRFLLAANRDTNNVVVFKREIETGLLEATGVEVQIPLPVCVLF